MKISPAAYIAAMVKLFEALSSRIPAMMLRIKDELDRAYPDVKDKIVMSHLLEERKIVENKLAPLNFDELMAYERKSGAEIKKYLATHPEDRKKGNDLQYRMKELLRT